MTTDAPDSQVCLTVMTENDNDTNAGLACVVDTSQGLEHVLGQISSTVGFDVDKLSLLVYRDGIAVTTPDVKDTQALTNDSVVKAVKREATPPSSMRSEEGEDSEVQVVSGNDSSNIEDPPTLLGKFKVGTKVRKLFDIIGWNNGKIVAVDAENQRYKLFYSCGGIEFISFEDPQMGEIVLRGRTRGVEAGQQDSFYDSSSDVEESAPKKNLDLYTRTRHESTPLLTDKQRQELQGIEISLKGFVSYLERKEGLCDSNVKGCQRQVGKLAAGEGISYQGWPAGILFRPTSLDMSSNFHQLWIDAKAHETKYGQDRSGLVLKTPVQKLEAYQHYYFHNVLNSKQDLDSQADGSRKRNASDLGTEDDDGFELSDNDGEDYEAEGVTRRMSNEMKRARHQAGSLSSEQRKSLIGMDLDVRDLEKFLIQEEGLSDFMVGRYIRFAQKLSLGEGVLSRDWPDDVLFHSRKVDMSEDFQQLLEEYKNHESRYSQSPFVRKYMIPLCHKLQRYQRSCFNLKTQHQEITI